MTVVDTSTGQVLTIPPCEEYVRTFKPAVIRWELIGSYIGEEIKIEPSLYKTVASLGRQHELEAKKLCDSAFGLFEAGRLSHYTCRDTFLRTSASQIEEINLVFDEVSKLPYKEIKKQSERINQLLSDYQQRFLPLDRVCGPPGTGVHQKKL
jgi:hypothetical protein